MCAMRNIRVVPYNPAWAEAYEEEASRLAVVFGEELVAIHHIGSTSVPGLSAKPVIDIMPAVRDIERVERFNEALAHFGYEARGENGIPGRRFYIKGGDVRRTHNVHIYDPDHPEVARHLNFCAYLRAHPEEAQRYARLKVQLAEKFPDDIFGYMAGKDAFIKEILVRAEGWAPRRPARRSEADPALQSGALLPGGYAVSCGPA